MKYTITFDIPDELLTVLRAAGQLALGGGLRVECGGKDRSDPTDPPHSTRHTPPEPTPPVRPHREPDPADDDEAAGVQRDDGKPMSGNQLLGWIGEQSDPRGTLKRAQALGKKHGYGWQIKGWKADQVARVYGELTAVPWGGRAAQ